MIKGIDSVLQSVEKMPQISKDDLYRIDGDNALGDWKKVELWAAKTLRQACYDNNFQKINQKSMEIDIIATTLKRVKKAKGGDCIENWDNFYHIFSEWKEKFFENNKENSKMSTSFISVIETDLLQRNLAMYRNGDHGSKRVESLLFYFRKQAGRNFLKQVVPSTLYPEGWIWTIEEVDSIKEQLDEQFSACIKALEEPLRLSIMEKHKQLQISKNDTLWWLADVCLQDISKDDSILDLLDKIIYYCYGISIDGNKMQVDQTLWNTYQQYNPLAGNFVSIYKINFPKNYRDNICIKDNDRARNTEKKIRNELKGKYEGEELDREVEKRLKEIEDISIDAPISNDNKNGNSIGSLLPDEKLSPEDQANGSQMAIFMLRAFTETVNSRKHLIRCDDDLFFTEIVSQMIREDKYLAEHVHQNEKLYTETCDMDFLNSYLQQSVTNIYESRECSLKKIQDFHSDEQNPKYACACGFPLDNIVYRQFIHVKYDSNITEKRKTFRKHMRMCLISNDLIR